MLEVAANSTLLHWGCHQYCTEHKQPVNKHHINNCNLIWSKSEKPQTIWTRFLRRNHSCTWAFYRLTRFCNTSKSQMIESTWWRLLGYTSPLWKSKSGMCAPRNAGSVTMRRRMKKANKIGYFTLVLTHSYCWTIVRIIKHSFNHRKTEDGRGFIRLSMKLSRFPNHWTRNWLLICCSFF